MEESVVPIVLPTFLLGVATQAEIIAQVLELLKPKLPAKETVENEPVLE
jgi:hypothetical protein